MTKHTTPSALELHDRNTASIVHTIPRLDLGSSPKESIVNSRD